MASTLFRFVTVRGPRKLTLRERHQRFVDYNSNLQAPLIQAVLTLVERFRREPGHEHADFLKSLVAIATADESRTKVFVSSQDLVSSAPHLDDWMELLEETEALPTPEQVAAMLPHHDLAPTKQVEAKIWDTLFAATYSGLSQTTRETAIWALRAIKLRRVVGEILDSGSSLDASGVLDLATATVVLPFSAPTDEGAIEFIDDKPQPDDGPRPGRQVLDEKKARTPYAEMRRIEKAAEELQSVRRLAFVERDAFSDFEPTGPKRGCDFSKASNEPKDDPEPLLDEKLISHLSPETQKVVSEFRVAELPIEFATNRLRAAHSTLPASSVGVGTATVPVRKVGGAFWAPSRRPPHEHVGPSAPPPRRLDDSYIGFYLKAKCRVKPIGIADLRRVEQELHCNEPGEIAHIENVMQGESRIRETRRLRRTEETLITSEERETTDERDTQTTDRFEMERESSKEVEKSVEFDLGTTIAGSYGPVKVEVSSNLATLNSTTESAKTASKYARDITERALKRVVEKVREERTTKTVAEFEEKNHHSLVNTAGDRHVVGLYRWVNKIYKAKIVNYGRRLMFEFMIPEPAAFHLQAMTEGEVAEEAGLRRPVDPRSDEINAIEEMVSLGLTPLKSALDIDETNYAVWAALYGATVTPPPVSWQKLSETLSSSGDMDGSEFAVSLAEGFTIPDGYESKKGRWRYGFHATGDNWLTIMVGQRHTYVTEGGQSGWKDLIGNDATLPVTVMGKTTMFGVNIEVNCERRTDHLNEWKHKTFEAVLSAYETQLAEYKNALAEAAAVAGVQIRGSNPLLNRNLEQQELKKGAIRMLTRCRDVWSNAMKDGEQADECPVPPEFDCCEAIRDGAFVQFMEQSFEWSLMTYLFYPYFWGRKCNWEMIYKLDDADPQFLAFLQAGYGKVVVPVRPGYEAAIMRFLHDGVIWNGGSVPAIDSEMYLSADNEMREAVGQVDPKIEPWFITVPTSLTALQCESGCIQGSGLPCPGGDDNNWGVGTAGVLTGDEQASTPSAPETPHNHNG